MPRTREFDEYAALDAAIDVFWTTGFEGTSLPMLLDAMGLSKSSFYLAFESKEALFVRCLERYGDALVAAMDDALDRAGSAMSFIRRALEGVGDEGRGGTPCRGCLIMNTAGEFGQRRPAFSTVVALNVDRFVAVFERALIRAGEEGDWDVQARPKVVASFLVSTLSGLKTMAMAGASRASLRRSADVALSALQ